MASRPQIVHISDSALSEYSGQKATVIQKKLRRRGPRTTNNRFDYLLRLSDGREMWFWDTEIEA